MDILRTIQEARQDHTTLSMLQIQKLQRLHKELTSFCEQRYDDKDQKKHLTTVELEHLTAADKLYIQMEIERITNCTMLADLLKNIRELPSARSDVMFADPASIILFSRCFELGNIYNRTEVLDRSFQGFQDSLMRKKELMMETLELGVQRSLKDMNIDTIDVSYFERWKKVYEEEMDCWSNWIFPIFTSCFCVVLSKNIKEEQSNLKKNDAKEVSIMYKELSDYINKNNLKMSAMTFDDELLSNATTNDTRYMPPSLLRPGRFDYVIYLQPPIGEIAENIVSYYLRDKDLAEDVLISDIVKAMPKVSCATLGTVMNLAALNSVYQGHEHIQKEDITEALLQVEYKLQKTDKETDSSELQKIAVHEAAHAVVGEVLHPGSIGIVTVRGSQGVIGGMANGCATYAQNEEEFLDEVTKTLAGRAGVSLIYGVMDIQASADIEQADKLMDIWLCHFAGGGFVGIESGDNRMSEQRLSYNEAIKSAKLEELYRRAYKILHNNKYFLLAVQHGLLEHETLLNSDLAKIRESCI